MPVLKPITIAMDCLKSAEFIQELKAETEKIVCKQNSSRKPTTPGNIVCHEQEYPYDSKQNHVTTFRRNVIPYPDHNYGQQPPLTPPGLNSPDPNEQTDTGNEDEDEEGVTRCICGFSHDDGYMICCDRCGTWQHIECMGIKSDSVPDAYLCGRCEPRTLDVERARAIQTRKKTRHSDDDGDDDTDTDEELPGSTSYTAISNTPTRITLTANSAVKSKGRNQLKNSSVENQGKRRKIVNRKRQRKHSRPGNEGIPHNDSNSMDIFICSDNFQSVESCIYDEAVTNLKLQNTNNLMHDFDFDKTKFCVAEVRENKKGLVATEDIIAQEPITEYKGKVSLLSTFEERSPFFKRACPFVLYYNKIDKLELVIDARLIGNAARYIQRSCEPNSETRHTIINGKIHVIITCTKDIAKGTQITIPFEYPLESYMGYINCACNQITCIALQYNQKFFSQSGRKRARYSNAESSTRNSASENQGDTDTDDNEVDVGSGERPLSRRKKLSREERKLQAYVKQIEKMEKKEKRNPKALTQRPMQLGDAIISQPMCSVSNRIVHSNGLVVPQSPVPPTARRISTGTPGSARKRLSVSKKRPRISSCSSDPLSPDLSSLMTTAPTAQTAPTTPIQESTLHLQPFSLDQNVLLRQKVRKDKEQLSLSMSLEKPAMLRDMPRKLRKYYIETKAGSPTPPTTPGQLSPASRTYTDQSLSVDVTSSLASPSNSFNPDRRNVLNGLLQIADQTDNESTCSGGSPLTNTITSNGMATAEEVMGDMMMRDSGVHTPSGKVISRRASRDCGYYGSLKKRWLVQYDGKALYKPRPVNGVIPASLSSLVNDYSIRKRADQITSYSLLTPQSCLPLKKRRLRAALAVKNDALLNGDTKKPEIVHAEEKLEDGKEEPSRKEIRLENKLQESCNGENSESRDVADDILQESESKVAKADGLNDIGTTFGKVTAEMPINASVSEIEDNNGKMKKSNDENMLVVKTVEKEIENEIAAKLEEESKDYITKEGVILKGDYENEQNSNNETKIATSVSLDCVNLQQKHKENSQSELITVEDSKQAELQNIGDVGTVAVSSQTSEHNKRNLTNEAPKENETEIINSSKTDILGQLNGEKLENVKLQSNQTSILTPANDRVSKDSNRHSVIPGKDSNSDSIISDKDSKRDSIIPDQDKILKDSKMDFQINNSSAMDINNSNIEITKADSVVSSYDNYSTRTDSSVTIAIGVEPERLSAMIRDPRLSSSSSRSSRDSLDNVFARSDSVSSVDEVAGQRLDSEKRSLSGSVEKLDATPGVKKKVSLREYRNRKRTQPTSSAPVQNNSTKSIEAAVPKIQEEAPTTLFTDTDSLLTPRTLTLSTGFGSREALNAVPSALHAPLGVHSVPVASGIHASSVLHCASAGSSVLHPVGSGIHPAASELHPAASELHPAASELYPAASGIHASSKLHPALSGLHPPASGLHPASNRHPVAPEIHSASSGLHTFPSAIHPASSAIQLTSSLKSSVSSMLPGSSVTPQTLPVMAAAPQFIPHASAMHIPSAVMYQGDHLASTGPMFEPVSPGDDYVAEPVMANQNKPVSMLSNQPFVNFTNVMSNVVRRSLPGSPCDAMDIEDDASPSVNKIQVGMPHVDARKHYLQSNASNFDRQGAKSIHHIQQIRGLAQVNKNIDSRSPNNKQSHVYNQQFRG